MTFQRGLLSLLLSVSLLAALLPTAVAANPEPVTAAQAEDAPAQASGFSYAKYSLPGCTGPTFSTDIFSRDDCGFVSFDTTNTTAQTVIKVEFADARTGTVFHTADPANTGENGSYEVPIEPADTWPAGEIVVRVLADGKAAGESQFRHNFLEAELTAAEKAEGAPYTSGEEVPVTGTIAQLDTGSLGNTTRSGVPAKFTLDV